MVEQGPHIADIAQGQPFALVAQESRQFLASRQGPDDLVTADAKGAGNRAIVSRFGAGARGQGAPDVVPVQICEDFVVERTHGVAFGRQFSRASGSARGRAQIIALSWTLRSGQHARQNAHGSKLKTTSSARTSPNASRAVRSSTLGLPESASISSASA